MNAAHREVFAASSLFLAFSHRFDEVILDTDNVGTYAYDDPFPRYQFWDSTPDPASGYFLVDGIAQGAQQTIDVSAAQLSFTEFQSGSGADLLWVRVNDGTAWSTWESFSVSAPLDQRAIVTAIDQIAPKNSVIAASSLFTVSDSDPGDLAVDYEFYDATADPKSGYFAYKGIAQDADHTFEVSAANLANATFVSGTISVDDLWVRAFDGMLWSDWTEFHVRAPNHAPVVTGVNVTLAPGESVPASSMFTATDIDASDTISRYQIGMTIRLMGQPTTILVQIRPDTCSSMA